ncbi:MAG: DUF1549 domain-containing protein [Acidobacteriota bacterium]|nr:DUF1549 domain-containing protein [Acidobacteriota bacterium]
MKWIQLTSLLLLWLPGLSAQPAPVAADEETRALIAAFKGADKTKSKRRIDRADDATFLRRVTLDLTGRLPTPSELSSFKASTDSRKRAKAIDRLMNTEAFVDRWTTFFEDLFKVRRFFDTAVYRNPFHDLIRGMVAENRSWKDIATTVLTTRGKGSQAGSAFLFYSFEMLEEEFRLDFLDDQTNLITEAMLGMRTECISCHDGAYHLEEVNKGLSVRKRSEFWGMAAFLARTYPYFEYPEDEDEFPEDDEAAEGFYLAQTGIFDMDKDTYDPDKGEIENTDELPSGEYNAKSQAGEGMRPPRNGGVIEPAYLGTGEKPRPGESRREALARMITSDRQFARNMVNRVWAHFFGEGFVMPLVDWDMGRLTPESAQSFNTTVQARDYRLMEFLTDEFIKSNYNMRTLIKLVTNSELYQWNFAVHDKSNKRLGYWRTNNRVRRLDAEAIIDGINDALELPRRYMIAGKLDRTYTSTWQLPGTDEPSIFAIYDLFSEDEEPLVDVTDLGYDSEETYFFFQEATSSLLNQLGRGDYFNAKDRDNTSSITMSLTMMNGFEANWWVDYWQQASPVLTGLRRDLDNGAKSPEAALNVLFQRFLFRDANQVERQHLLPVLQSGDRERGLTDVTWVLINHPDFLYNR